MGDYWGEVFMRCTLGRGDGLYPRIRGRYGSLLLLLSLRCRAWLCDRT